jgi:hypothetical protein
MAIFLAREGWGSTTLGIYAHRMSKDRLAAQDDVLAAMVKFGELTQQAPIMAVFTSF